ncbi:MAG: MSHA biogenesis protein MshJ [Pseudohongiellaceae bacterium]|jgi:MSHA biogenesis protein MshJ
MNEQIREQLAKLAQNIESRKKSERIMVLGIVTAGLFMLWLSVAFDPLQASISSIESRIGNVERQITAQQTAYAQMLAASQEDPNRFANDRIQAIAREQAQLDQQIADLAGDLVTPNQMTQILTTVLERQSGLQLVYFQNQDALPLRAGVSDAATILAETGAVNFDDTTRQEVTGQVYEHGLTIEFQGDYFSTLKYLRFLEEITGSFFWDAITFRQLEWPEAHVTLEIHTLSTDEGFIGV